MNFHSVEFVLFFGIVLSLYWRLPLRWQNLFLLTASYVFYGWAEPRYLALIFAVTLTDYCMARLIESRPGSKRTWLGITLLVDFSVLLTFKYLGFFVGTVTGLLESFGIIHSRLVLELLLPIGISFYVFQSSAYVIDVFRGQKPTRRFFDYALFVSFFPQLVAGPIERSSHLLGQLQSSRLYDADRIRSGFLLLLWGFFKKLVIADNAATICNRIFATETTEWPLLWVGVFAFGIQIYADFSAYTDIARGAARMMGINLIENFRHPYLSRSPSEFWRRWHISLSSWFRDYVYIPLGGNRGGRWRTYRNLMLTFLLSGLWHGASWNFVLWGGFHGLLLVGERMLRDVGRIRHTDTPPRWWTQFLSWLLMFVLIHFGWMLFRETNFAYIRYYLTLNPLDTSAVEWQMAFAYFLVAGFYSLPLWIHPLVEEYWTQNGIWERLQRAPIWGRFALESICGVILFFAILWLGSSTTSDFIYFQF